MGVASLVLGIVTLVTGWIPFWCLLMLLLAVIGLILGIVDTVKKSKAGNPNKGVSIGGIVTSAIAIVITVIMSISTIGIITYSTSTINKYTPSYKYDYEDELEDLYDDLYDSLRDFNF